MESAVKEIITALVFIVQIVPMGTNLNLVRLLWVMVNGSFLESRGAVHSGLQSNDFTAQAVRSSWSGLQLR